MSSDWFQKFDVIAKEMDEARASESSTVGYDVLTDALTWSDEYPLQYSGRLDDFECIKILQRYRTTVLVQKPEEALKPYWDYAKSLFPHWAGFAKDRIEPNLDLLEYYQRASKRDMRLLNAIFKGSKGTKS